MFPHMYKVRPPRPGRRGEGPPSAECEWQGDTTRRRNSNNRWNPNNLEGTSTPTPSTSTPASPLPATPFAPPFATPPPIPAPPPEAQETLHKMTSPAARLDGVEATNQANFNASPVPWRRERSRTSSPAAAKQPPVRRRERPVSAHSQETDPARVMPSPIPASVSEPAPGKENSSRDSSPAVRRLRQENRSRTNSPRPTTPKELPSSRDSSPAVRQLKQENRSRTNSPRPTTPKELPSSRDSSPAVRQLKQENRSRTNSPRPATPKELPSLRDSSPAVRQLKQENRSRTNSPRPTTPKELPSSRPESASPIPTMEAPAYAKTYTPPVPLEAVVVDATSPQPQTFTTTVPIVIERHTQDQKPEVQRSASPLAAHQLQQKQQRQQTPVQQLHPEDQQQQQQRRRQRSPSSPPEEWGTPQEHLGSSPAFLACRSRTSSPAVAPPQEIQQEEQVIPQQAAEENSRDSRGTSPAVVFQMDCDPPAVGQTPPVEPTKPQENNAIIEDNMLLKDSIPLECYAPMDDLPISTNEFQDIMSTLDMDMDDMDEFRKALEITNDTPLQPPRETSGSPADHAPVAEIEGAKQPPQGSELAKVFRERKAAADRRGVEPGAQTLSEDHSPTPKPTLQIPELRPTSIAHPRQRPKESIPVPTPPPSSEPQDVPQSHDGDGSLTKETNSLPWWEQTDDTRSWSPGSPIFKKDVINNRCDTPTENWWEKDDSRAASPEPPVIAPPPPKSDSPAVWWFDDISQSIPPPPPVMPGKHIPAPPPPPMPGQPAFEMPKLRPMTERKRKTIDCIKKAARGRPDWFSVMKNIEGGVQLRHVDYDQKSDRSRPMLPSSRGRDGQFLYESEKPNQHNALLNQISRGVRLRRVKTNDRSSVDFKSLGMKKFRRQVTVEEKEKKDKEDALPSSSDEEEDIDKMRDDLEATKAQITEELKHRRKAERENKILKIDVDSLNAQIKKLKRQLKEAGITNGPLAGEDEIIPKLEKSMSRLRMREEEEDFSELDNLETEINNLKSQADAHKKVAEDWERKYQNMEQKLQVSETTADEWESRSIYFEKKFRALQKEHNIELPDIGCVGTQTDPADFPPPTPVAPPPAINEDLYAIPRKSSSRRSFSSQFSRMESFKEEDSEDSDRSESEEDDDDMGAEADMEEEEEDGGDDEAAMARKAENEAKRKERDLNLWKSKLTHMKEKEGNVQRERNNLRERIKKYFRDMKTERQEYLKVKADMDELAGVVKEPSEYEESEEEELPPEAEDGVCWFEPAPKKKKLKKRRRRLNADGEEIEDEEEEEDLEDLSLLEEPEWTDSECAESETDNEEEEFNNRLGKLSDRTRKHELHMNKMKKDNYLLKGQVERADEMYLVERRRHQRQDEELHMILAEM